MKVAAFFDCGTAILDDPETDGGRSRMTMSGSESFSSLVRSMALSVMLSLDALSASRWASSPEPHPFSY